MQSLNEKIAVCQCDGTAQFKFELRGFQFFDCHVCELRFVNPRYLPNELYASDYFSGATHGFGFTNYEEDKIASRSYLEFLLDQIATYTSAGRQLLDIGAANGFFVALSKKAGFDSFGIELSDSAVSWARKLGRQVEVSSIEEFNTDKKFDVVTMLDVLEHLAEPKIAILKIRELMNRSGILVINIPDRSSFFSRICGTKWHAYLPPEHWFYFNKKSVTRLLTGAGFEIRRIGNLSKSFKISYILKTVENSPQFPKWINGVSHFLVERLHKKILKINIKIPLRDNLFVVAVRKDF